MVTFIKGIVDFFDYLVNVSLNFINHFNTVTSYYYLSMMANKIRKQNKIKLVILYLLIVAVVKVRVNVIVNFNELNLFVIIIVGFVIVNVVTAVYLVVINLFLVIHCNISNYHNV